MLLIYFLGRGRKQHTLRKNVNIEEHTDYNET